MIYIKYGEYEMCKLCDSMCIRNEKRKSFLRICTVTVMYRGNIISDRRPHRDMHNVCVFVYLCVCACVCVCVCV